MLLCECSSATFFCTSITMASTTLQCSAENGAAIIRPTDMIHMSYEGNFQLECDAKVLSAIQRLTGETVAIDVTLDRTTMHRQGGGQPSDAGVISSSDATVNVTKVTLDRDSGVVVHSGVLISGSGFHVGQTVHVSVDADTRRILSESHTAGHVVDSAMARCHYILPAVKAYHFLDGPYVEYKGNVPVEGRDKLVRDLQAAFQELVEEDVPTKIESMTRSEAELVCNRDSVDLSEYSEKDEIRIVTVAGWACPCGGTHVRSTADLKERKWNVNGIKSKKGIVRIKYGQNVE
jgi:Ser-tRNA(Ala) deacylase AlaX